MSMRHVEREFFLDHEERVSATVITDPNADRDNTFAKAIGFRHRGSLQDFLVFTSNHAAGRKPVLHPDDMKAILKSETVTFTNGSDVDIVIEKYRSFFKSVAEKATVLNFEAPMEAQAGGAIATYSSEDGALVLRRSAHVQYVSDRISPITQANARVTRPHRRKRGDPGRCTCRPACFARSRPPLVEKPLDQQLP